MACLVGLGPGRNPQVAWVGKGIVLQSPGFRREKTIAGYRLLLWCYHAALIALRGNAHAGKP